MKKKQVVIKQVDQVTFQAEDRIFKARMFTWSDKHIAIHKENELREDFYTKNRSMFNLDTPKLKKIIKQEYVPLEAELVEVTMKNKENKPKKTLAININKSIENDQYKEPEISRHSSSSENSLFSPLIKGVDVISSPVLQIEGVPDEEITQATDGADSPVFHMSDGVEPGALDDLIFQIDDLGLEQSEGTSTEGQVAKSPQKPVRQVGQRLANFDSWVDYISLRGTPSPCPENER